MVRHTPMLTAICLLVLLLSPSRAYSDETSGKLFERLRDGILLVAVGTPHSFGTGTGFVVRSGTETILMTNHHVVAGADSIEVVNSSLQTPRKAVVIADDERSDLAILAIGQTSLPEVELVCDGTADPGTQVWALGYPVPVKIWQAGVRVVPSLAAGVVAGSSDSAFGPVLQTDTAVTNGNSGGPLIRVSDGRAIGVISFAIRGESGLNFAIASSSACALLRILGIGPGLPAAFKSQPPADHAQVHSRLPVGAESAGSPRWLVGLLALAVVLLSLGLVTVVLRRNPAEQECLVLEVMGQESSLTHAMTVGRAADCDIRIDEPSVSRQHARLTPAGGKRVRIQDLSSHNGTWINGSRVDQCVAGPEDVVEFGRVSAKLRRSAVTAATRST